MTDWYVSYQRGSDTTGNGTKQNPYQKINACTAAQPGDRILVEKTPASTYLGELEWCDGEVSRAPGNQTSLVNAYDVIGNDNIGWWLVNNVAYSPVPDDLTIFGQEFAFYNKHDLDHQIHTYPTYKLGLQNVSGLTSTQTFFNVPVSGTASNYLRIIGGWNFDTDTADGMTVFRSYDAGTPTTKNGYGMVFQGKNYVQVENFGFIKFNWAFYSYFGAHGNRLINCFCSNLGGYGFNFSSVREHIIDGFDIYGSNSGVNATASGNSTFNRINILSTIGSYGIYLQNASSANIRISNFKILGGGSMNSINNQTMDLRLSNGYMYSPGLTNAIFTSPTIKCKNVTFDSIVNPVQFGGIGTYAYFANLQGSTNQHAIYKNSAGTITSDTSFRYGNDGCSWCFDPTITDEFNYLQLNFTAVPVVEGKPITVSCKVYLFNPILTVAELFLPAGQQTGQQELSVRANNALPVQWQELTLTYIPTQTGLINFAFRVYDPNGTSSVYIDDFKITQNSAIRDKSALDSISHEGEPYYVLPLQVKEIDEC